MLLVQIMIKIITNSFQFKNIFSLKNTKKSKMLIYFIILVLITAFPLNYQIFLNDGFKGMNSFTHELRLENPSWLPNELPNDVSISKHGMYLVNDREYIYETITNAGNKYFIIINPAEEITEAKNTIVLEKDQIIYFSKDGATLKGGYQNVDEVIDFSDLKNMNSNEAVDIFFSMIDSAFNQYGVFYAVVVNTLTQYLMNALLLIILAAIMLLIRVNYKKVTNFSENVNIVIASMTIPTLISFIFGVIGLIELSSLLVVVFQLLTPIIALAAIYKGGKEKEVSVKHL